jgi:hypothetical protein
MAQKNSGVSRMNNMEKEFGFREFTLCLLCIIGMMICFKLAGT